MGAGSRPSNRSKQMPGPAQAVLGRPPTLQAWGLWAPVSGDRDCAGVSTMEMLAAGVGGGRGCFEKEGKSDLGLVR